MARTRKKSHHALEAVSLLSGATALSLLIGIGQAWPAAAQDATNRFAHTKHTFVPATRFQRRYDADYSDYQSYPSTGQLDTSGDGSTPAGASLDPTTASPQASTGGRYGLIPPPPPMAPSQPANSSTASTSSGATPARRSTSTQSKAAAGSTATGISSRQHPASAGSVQNSPALSAFVARAQARSKQLVSAGKLAAADDMLQTDLKQLPNNSTLQTELANVRVARAKFALKTENNQEASKFAQAALDVQPNNVSAKSILARAASSDTTVKNAAAEHIKAAQGLIQQSRYPEAQEELQTALKIKPSADAHVGLGDLAFKQGNKELARNEYTKALTADPESGLALRQMGILKLEDNDVVGANKDLSRAVVLNPDDQVATGQLQKLWQDQVNKAPGSTNAHLGLARAYQLSGDLKSAQNEYREVVNLDPHHPSLPACRQSFKMAMAKDESNHCLQAARTLESEGALNEAHQKAVEAVNLMPNCISARLYQGAICEKLSRYKEAHGAYMAVLKEDPKNVVAARRLKAISQMANAQIGDSSQNAGSATQITGTSQSSLSGQANASGQMNQANQSSSLGQASQFGQAAGMTGMTAYQNSVAYGTSQPTTNVDANGANANAANAANGNSATASPNKPTKFYAFRGWQYGSPFSPQANAAAAGQDGSTDTTSGASAAGVGAGAAGMGALVGQAQTGQLAIASPNQMSAGPGTAGYQTSAPQWAEPAAPMPLQGQGPTPVPVPSPTAAHVATFSSFLGSLRNLNIQNQQQSAQAESVMQQSLGLSSSASGSSLGAAGAAGGAGDPGLASLLASVDSMPSAGSAGAAAAAGASATAAPLPGTPTTSQGALNQAQAALSQAQAVLARAQAPTSAPQTVTTLATSTAPVAVTNTPSSAFASVLAQAAASLAHGITPPASSSAMTQTAAATPAVNQSNYQSIVNRLRGPLTGGTVAPTSAMGGNTSTSASNVNGSLLSATPSYNNAQASYAAAPQYTAPSPSTSPQYSGAPQLAGSPTVPGVAQYATASSPQLSGSPPTAALAPMDSQDLYPVNRPWQDGQTVLPPDVTPVGGSAAAVNASGLTQTSTATGGSSAAVGTNANSPSRAAASISSAPVIAALPSTTAPSTQALSSAATTRSQDNPSDFVNASVQLELEGFNPTPTAVKLRVVLRNQRSKPLYIPEKATGIIHMAGKADQEAHVAFPVREVAAGAEVHGVIKVAGHDLDPAADLVLPNFLPPAFADRDLHLTVPISALMK